MLDTKVIKMCSKIFPHILILNMKFITFYCHTSVEVETGLFIWKYKLSIFYLPSNIFGTVNMKMVIIASGPLWHTFT